MFLSMGHIGVEETSSNYTGRNAKNLQTETLRKHVTTLLKHNGLQACVIVRRDSWRENYNLDAFLKISFYFHLKQVTPILII